MPLSNQKSKRDLLFWSGGKDSFLALQYFRDESNTDPVLLTTYDDESGILPHQNIPVKRIQDQALSLGLILFTVPISYPAPNSEYLGRLKQVFHEMPFQINRIIFGDLHLRDIREWREKQFEGMGYETIFPIWGKSYDELLNRLESENVSVIISGVADEFTDSIRPGDFYNHEFLKTLPGHIDPMGEKGEFHTEILFG